MKFKVTPQSIPDVLLIEPTADAGIQPHDPGLNISWPLPKKDHMLSSKDNILPFLSI